MPKDVTSRFSAAFPSGDQGGILVALCAKPCTDELHAFWDDVLGKDNSAATAIAAADKLPPASAAGPAVSDDTVWIRGSFAAAKQFVYASPVGPGAGPYPLNAHYKRVALSEAKSRIELAGARLADLLNANFR